ncbi:MAG: shikimate kinase [Candidatus Omnitrophica bacterium]|nr:shikimate kinase [Candidatus Omnitrophota bacterium]
MQNIYLVGMMGSGKTVTGRKLAKMTGGDFVDLDEVIETKNQQSIPEIFKQKGESFFRLEESIVLKEMAAKQNCVIATGGGIVLEGNNVELMRRTGQVVYLKGSLDVLWERVCIKNNRPLLDNDDPQGSLAKIQKERETMYQKASHCEIDTDHQSAEAVAKKIIKALENLK